MKKEVKQHLQTAKLLMDGIEESISTWTKENEGWHSRYINPPEHSMKSVVRRCVQIRQELLQVMKELQKYD